MNRSSMAIPHEHKFSRAPNTKNKMFLQENKFSPRTLYMCWVLYHGAKYSTSNDRAGQLWPYKSQVPNMVDKQNQHTNSCYVGLTFLKKMKIKAPHSFAYLKYAH